MRSWGNQERRALQGAYRALSLIPARGPASAVFEALAPCVPVTAGKLVLLRPGAAESMTSHNVGVPDELVDIWMRTPADLLAEALAPSITAQPGEMVCTAARLSPAEREKYPAVRALDGFGLGDAAQFKVLERGTPSGGNEHMLLTLVSERGETFTDRAGHMLAELTPALQAALLRMELPLLAREPLCAQIVEEQTIGYVCLSPSGALLETNRRAHELAARYHTRAGLIGQRHALADLAQRARERGPDAGAWRMPGRDGVSMVEIHVHRLMKEVHAVNEDVLLVMMREWSALPSLDLLEALSTLTPRQRQIAFLLARHGMAYKEVAMALGVSEGTVRKHAERIYRLMGVHSRAELARVLRG